MPHHADPSFWHAYRNLPEPIRDRADKAFDLLVQDPRHPSLQFKKVGAYWSARVTLGYRALAVEADDGLLWFWIGTHDEYVRLIAQP